MEYSPGIPKFAGHYDADGSGSQLSYTLPLRTILPVQIKKAALRSAAFLRYSDQPPPAAA